jgi:hypothetical protein
LSEKPPAPKFMADDNAATVFAHGKVWININLLRDILTIPVLQEAPGSVVVASLAEVFDQIENETIISISDQIALDNQLGE